MKTLTKIILSSTLALSLVACSDDNPLKSGSKSERAETVQILSTVLSKYSPLAPLEDYGACLNGTRVERNNFGSELDCNLLGTFLVQITHELFPNKYPTLKVEHIQDKKLYARIKEDLNAKLKVKGA